MSSSGTPPDDGPVGVTEDPPPPVTEPTPLGVPGRPGTGTFTIEGRATPGLFVVGWLATLTGFVVVAIGILSGGGLRATILLLIGLVLLSIGLVAAAGSQGIERRTRAALGYRGPSPFLVFAAAVPISLLAVIVLSVPLVALGMDVDGPVAALLSVTLQAIVYVGLVRLLVVDTGALDWRSMGIVPLDRRGIVELGGGALWAVPVIFVTAIVAQLLLNLFPVTPVSPLPPTGTTAGFIVSLVAGVLVAPFGEEILFRGFATTAWARGMGARRALVVGSLFFAFAHVVTIAGATAGDALGLAAVAFAGRIPVALALGWLFLRRGTIWAPFGLHAAFNGILLLVAEAYPPL